MIETKFKFENGYKIPDGWDASSLSIVGCPCMCKRVLKENTSLIGDIPFYKIGTFGKNPDAFISRSLYEELKSKFNYPKKGDILISASGTIGRTVIFNGEDSYFQDSNIIWLNNSEKIVSNQYLNVWLQVIKWSTTDGGTITRLYNKNISESIIVIPTPIEQERIATALNDIDELIITMRQLVKKKRNIKTGVMQKLLSGKKRLNGFSKEWKEEYLGNIADLYQPHTIGGNCFTNYGFDVYGANGIIGKYSSYNHETDQVLITCRGNTCGTINYSKGKCWINGNAMVVNMDNYDICKRFIYYYLTFQDFSSVISGSGQPQITRKPLNELKLFIPPTKAEQEAIAKVLSDMDTEIEQLEMRLTKYEDIKQGMMQQLLTGKIRLI